jgi:hypothetical protein
MRSLPGVFMPAASLIVFLLVGFTLFIFTGNLLYLATLNETESWDGDKLAGERQDQSTWTTVTDTPTTTQYDYGDTDSTEFLNI